MVHAMPYDRGWLPRVAWPTLIVGLSACVPASVPTGPGEGPTAGGGVGIVHARPRPTVSGKQVVVGEMCPLGAAGRPGLAPIAMRGVEWTDKADEIANVIERGAVPSFAVYGVDGKQAGDFETLGLAEIAPGQPVATGSYTGASPCTYEVTPKIPDAPNVKPEQAGSGSGSGSMRPKNVGSALATRLEDPACVPETNGCGIALAEIVHPDDPPSPPSFTTGGACLSGDELAVDIDGDGIAEVFPLRALLDSSRAPSAEWTAAPTAAVPCKPSFQLFNIQLGDADPGKAPDPKRLVTMDLLGVVDIDGDGRRELILSLRFPTVRSIVIYTPEGAAQRLVLAGEATSFPR
jgi:hypothetical protein